MQFSGSYKDFLPDFPQIVMLSVSNVCNCTCPHCPFNADSTLRNRDSDTFMSRELLLKIVEECVGEDTFFRVTGTGEPFLNKHLTEVLIEANTRGIKTGCITNGSFSYEEIEQLVQHNTDLIEISVDAYDKYTYEKLRKGLLFEETFSKIEHLIKCKKQYSSSTKLVVSAVDSNGVDIDKFNQFWKNLGVDNTVNRKFLSYDTFKIKDSTKTSCLNRAPCPYPFQRINVLSDGNVTFCNFDVKQDFFMGNVKDKTIKEIWHSELFNDWRKKIFKGKYDEIPLCLSCEDWKHKSWTHNMFKVIASSK